MAENNDDAAELHPSQVIGAFGQPLLAGRRVAVLGDCTTGLPEAVAKASGRRVHAYDPDRERVAAALAQAHGRRAPRVSQGVLDDSLDSRDGVFDAVVIADLAELADVETPLQLARSLLSPRGLLVLASPNPDWAPGGDEERAAGLGYYDLYDRIADVFDEVRMLGQAPFLGFTVAEFAAEGEPGVTIDSSLVARSEEPAYYVAVASNHAVDLDPYTLIQVPSEAGRAWLWPAGGVARRADDSAAAQAERERKAVEGQLEALRAQQRDTERLARERRDAATALSARVAELEAALQDQSQKRAAEDKRQTNVAAETARKLRESEAQRQRDRERFEQERLAADEEHQQDLDRMLERIAELEGDVEGEEQDAPAEESPSPGAARAYEFQLSELKKALAQARSECNALRAEAGRVAALEAELAAATQERERAVAQAAKRATAGDDDVNRRHADEIDQLEERLKERGGMVSRLQAELKEGERVGRELLRELELARAALDAGPAEPPAPAPPAPPATAEAPAAAQVEALVQKCCRYEADAQAARWTIAALEAKLDEQQGQDSADDQLAAALRAAQQELAELRQQLASSSDE